MSADSRTEARKGARGGATLRLRIACRVGLAVLLATAATVLLCWLAERPGLRWRADWTGGGQNTLSPAAHAVLEKMDADVAIDAFFTPIPAPATRIGFEVQERTLRLLVLLRDSSGGRVRIRQHDLASQLGLAAARARLQELMIRDVPAGGIVVVAADPRHEVLRLHGDLADVDPGDPRGEQGPPRPPRLVQFRAEESLVSAILKVGLGDTLKVLVSAGHGERDLDDTGLQGLSLLRQGLASGGFVVGRFEGGGGGKLPEDCDILAVLGPDQPFTSVEADALREFVESGGRLVAAPGRVRGAGASGEPGSLTALLQGFGIRVVADGIVAEPRASIGGPVYETPECGEVRVGSDGLSAMSPVTDSLKRADRYVLMPFGYGLERSPPPPGGSVQNLVTTESSAWRDVPNSPTATGHDWKPSPTEARGPFVLGMTSVFRPRRLAQARRIGSGEAQPESRVLCLGSADAFANAAYEVNRDLLLNGFDWAAAREFRVHVEPKSRVTRRLDVASGGSLSRVHLAAVVLLPGACLALGLLTAWRRRRR